MNSESVQNDSEESEKELDFAQNLYQQSLKNLRNLIVKVHCCMKVKSLSQFLFHPYLMQ
ncbi:hypothetical protein HN873_031936, partial [Arachis hypogaea]